MLICVYLQGTCKSSNTIKDRAGSHRKIAGGFGQHTLEVFPRCQNPVQLGWSWGWFQAGQPENLYFCFSWFFSPVTPKSPPEYAQIIPRTSPEGPQNIPRSTPDRNQTDLRPTPNRPQTDPRPPLILVFSVNMTIFDLTSPYLG